MGSNTFDAGDVGGGQQAATGNIGRGRRGQGTQSPEVQMGIGETWQHRTWGFVRRKRRSAGSSANSKAAFKNLGPSAMGEKVAQGSLITLSKNFRPLDCWGLWLNARMLDTTARIKLGALDQAGAPYREDVAPTLPRARKFCTNILQGSIEVWVSILGYPRTAIRAPASVPMLSVSASEALFFCLFSSFLCHCAWR